MERSCFSEKTLTLSVLTAEFARCVLQTGAPVTTRSLFFQGLPMALALVLITALTAGAVVTTGVVHGIKHSHHVPECYGERFGGPPRPYFKPGVDTPRDVAIRNFEAEMNREISDLRMGR